MKKGKKSEKEKLKESEMEKSKKKRRIGEDQITRIKKR